MNGEEQRSSSPKWGLGQPLRRLRRHLPMNGEEQRSSSPKRGLGQPLRPFGPPPHEWGGAGFSPSCPSGHLPMNGEEQSSAPPAAVNGEEQAAAGSTLTATCVGQV